MFTYHVIEGSGVKDVGMPSECACGSGEVFSELLDRNVIVVEGQGSADAKGVQGCGKAAYSAQGIDGSDACRKGRRGADGSPDVGGADVEEANSCVWKTGEKENGVTGGRE